MRARIGALACLAVLAVLPPVASDRYDADMIVEELTALRERTNQLESMIRGRQLLNIDESSIVEQAPVRELNHYNKKSEECQQAIFNTIVCYLEYAIGVVIWETIITWPVLIVAVISNIFFNSGVYFFLGFFADVAPPFRNLSLNLVVANMYFLPTFQFAPGTTSVCFIIFTTVLADFVQSQPYIKGKRRAWYSSNSSGVSCHEQTLQETTFKVNLPRLHSPGDMTVTNRYMKLSSRMSQVALVFCVQFCLFLFYGVRLGVRKSELPEAQKNGEVSYLKWAVAVALCFLAAETELGGRYSGFFWEDVAQVAETEGGLFYNKSYKGLFGFSFKFKNEWQLRRFCSFLVNGVVRAVILGTAPILLCTLAPLDFIANAMAAFFITRLDDLEDGKSMIEELVNTYSAAFPDDPKTRKLMRENVDCERRATQQAEQDADDEELDAAEAELLKEEKDEVEMTPAQDPAK